MKNKKNDKNKKYILINLIKKSSAFSWNFY